MAAIQTLSPKHQIAQLASKIHCVHHGCHEDHEADPDTSDNIMERPFVGRLGGNQQFTAPPSQHARIVQTTPDAASILLWKESFNLRPFTRAELWKQALFEGWATCLFVFLDGLLVIALAPLSSETLAGSVVAGLLGALELLIILSLFIYTTAPISGGHINPLVTIGTFFGRLATLPRMVLYVGFQLIGATIGAFLLRAALGEKLPAEKLGGCYINPSLVSPAQAYILETMSSTTLLYFVFGTGLDPRQKNIIGPTLSPILIGFAFFIISFTTGFVKIGYTGASINPARCFGLMAASEHWDYHYIHWVGDITGALLNAVFYWSVLPGWLSYRKYDHETSHLGQK